MRARTRAFAQPLLLAGAVLAGCARPAGPVKSAPAAAAPPKPEPAQDPASRLAGLLRGIQRPGAVLDALPANARSALDARYAALDAQRKADARNENGPLVESMPLLHL